MKGPLEFKAQEVAKPFPGCLGRMVNLFDLNAAVNVKVNKLLTDKPHVVGSTLGRSQSDVTGVLSAPFGDLMEDKMIVLSELRRTASNGTSIKKLIAEEMSKEVGSKQSPPNVVAKLMGLDTLPKQHPDKVYQRNDLKGYSQLQSNRLESGFMNKQIQRASYQQQKEYKDVQDVWRQSHKAGGTDRDSSPGKGRQTGNINGKKMNLVRQKFMEAKRLATDEKLRQSKEFQEALEVLSTNKDVLLKFLQEPNSLLSQHMFDFQSILPPPETKCITILRPSKMDDNETFAVQGKKSSKSAKKSVQVVQATGCSPPCANAKVDQRNPAKLTRIVVLKPTTGKTHDLKAVVPFSPSSPRTLSSQHCCEEPQNADTIEAREVAKEITDQICINLISQQMDETLLSSHSNGYAGDDSSFVKSEDEYVDRNLSDSEITSPTSKHSWDYVNRKGTPFFPSFSRASCSPESSVCREAKKRLSERWALMSSNVSLQEQKHAYKSSSTLGEMLALSDTKMPVISDEEIDKKEEKPRVSASCFTSYLNKEEGIVGSPNNLLRSKSVPVSLTMCGSKPHVETCNAEDSSTQVTKGLIKSKSTKSLKGKVSNLLFSRNKGSSKEKSNAPHSKNESQLATPETPSSSIDFHRVNDGGPEDYSFLDMYGSPSKSSLDSTGVNMESREVGIPLCRLNISENQDQPSPISVLEPLFEDDGRTPLESSSIMKPGHQGMQVPLKSSLIDKSPLIGSISRTLSWEDSCTETATPRLFKSLSVSSVIDEEQDWHFLIDTLLSAAGLDGTMSCSSVLSRWHSPESPLDPSLRDKYSNQNLGPVLHEPKRRQRRSNRKLVFDCVNAALMETMMMDHWVINNNSATSMVVDHVWAQIEEWFNGDVKCVLGEDGGDCNSLVVELLVKKEVEGKTWAENMRVEEVDQFRKELVGKLLEQLVEEAVADLTAR